DQMLKSSAQLAFTWGMCSGPVWLIGLMVVALSARPHWSPYPAARSVRLDLWLLAAAALLVWIPIFPYTQPGQQMGRHIERIFAEGRTEEALAEMPRHASAEFPPNWDPPPHVTELHDNVDLLSRLMKALSDEPQAPWVRELYVAKFRAYLRGV